MSDRGRVPVVFAKGDDVMVPRNGGPFSAPRPITPIHGVVTIPADIRGGACWVRVSSINRERDGWYHEDDLVLAVRQEDGQWGPA